MAIKLVHNTGLFNKKQGKLAEKLTHVLSDTYILYLKCQNFHWNVTGMNFHSFHELFQEFYEELAKAVDNIAERIRALGAFAPGSFNEFLALSKLKEAKGNTKRKTIDMVRELLSDNESIILSLRQLTRLAEEAQDQPTLDLLTERLRIHEKNSWMLNSCLD